MSTIHDHDTTTPAPGPAKSEAKNDGLAVTALTGGLFFWPLGLLFGHVSNHAAKKAGRKRSVLAIVGLVAAYLWAAILALVIGITAASGCSPAPAPAAAPPAASAPAKPATPASPPASQAPASQAPATQAPASKVLLDHTGSATWTSAPFTVAAGTTLKVTYSFWGNDNSNFAITFDGDVFGVPANTIATSGGTTSYVYPDTDGTAHIEVMATGGWHVTITQVAS
jgi:hypothetical protein